MSQQQAGKNSRPEQLEPVTNSHSDSGESTRSPVDRDETVETGSSTLNRDTDLAEREFDPTGKGGSETASLQTTAPSESMSGPITEATLETTSRKKVIFVLGMHRSGSSALTRGLQALGCDLGENLMPALEENNPKGFFEDLDLNGLNDRVLEQANSGWDKLAILDATKLSGQEFADLRHEAARMLNLKVQDTELFAFKDPRTAVLMPFWRCVLDDLNLDDRYVITVRNPLEVAYSLNARDDFDVRKGVYLWAKHMADAVRYTEGKPRVFISFDRTLSDPVAQLARISRMAGLDVPRGDDPSIRLYKDEFLDLSLRHNLAGRGEFQRSGVVPPFVADLYDWLFEQCTDEKDMSEPLGEALSDTLDTSFERAAPLLRFADILEAKQEIEAEKVKTTSAELEKANGDLNSANAEIDRLNQAIAEISEKARVLEEESLSAQEELRALQFSNAEEIGLLTDARDQALAAVAKSEGDLASERNLRKIAEQQRDDTRRNIASLAATLEAEQKRLEFLEADLGEAQVALKVETNKAEMAEANAAAQIEKIEAEFHKSLQVEKEIAKSEFENAEQARRACSAAQLARDAALARTGSARRRINEQNKRIEELKYLINQERLRGDTEAAKVADAISRADQVEGALNASVERYQNALAERQQRLVDVRTLYLLKSSEMEKITQSRSWKVTRVIRGGLLIIRSPVAAAKAVARKLLRRRPMS